MINTVPEHDIEIVSLKLNLSHPSNKHEIFFTFKNNKFGLKKYNLVYQINDCKKNEEISFVTHGLHQYKVYVKKSCISNKKNTLSFFSELIGVTDDSDRSNTFSFSKIKNFSRSKRIVLKEDESFNISLPFSWLYLINSSSNIVETPVGFYKINLKNISNISKSWKLADFLELSLLKDKNVASIEWKAKKLSSTSSFFDNSNNHFKSTDIPYYKKGTNNNESWILGVNVISEYIPYDDLIKYSTINSLTGLFLPLYQVLSPFNMKLELSFDFLYSIDYELIFVLDNKKKAIGIDCGISKYCALITDSKWTNNSKRNSSFKFDEDFSNEFLLSGFSYDWFKDNLELKYEN